MVRITRDEALKLATERLERVSLGLSYDTAEYLDNFHAIQDAQRRTIILTDEVGHRHTLEVELVSETQALERDGDRVITWERDENCRWWSIHDPKPMVEVR